MLNMRIDLARRGALKYKPANSSVDNFQQHRFELFAIGLRMRHITCAPQPCHHRDILQSLENVTRQQRIANHRSHRVASLGHRSGSYFCASRAIDNQHSCHWLGN